jgi:hypothetical protein
LPVKVNRKATGRAAAREIKTLSRKGPPGSRSDENGPVHRGEDYLFFVDRALDRMSDIVSDLGDDLANLRPDLPNANSAYQILTHCMGVVEYWVGHLIAGRENNRDRDAEFRASGRVDELVSRVKAVQQKLRADIATMNPADPLRSQLAQAWIPKDREFTQEMALIHVVEELCQHCGHMELTRDILQASAA